VLGNAGAAAGVVAGTAAGAAAGTQGRAFAIGAPADIVVFDRAERWTVEAASMLTKGHGNPLAGRSLPGAVLLTLAGGRLAFELSRSD
jgi:dihydroorotase